MDASWIKEIHCQNITPATDEQIFAREIKYFHRQPPSRKSNRSGFQFGTKRNGKETPARAQRKY